MQWGTKTETTTTYRTPDFSAKLQDHEDRIKALEKAGHKQKREETKRKISAFVRKHWWKTIPVALVCLLIYWNHTVSVDIKQEIQVCRNVCQQLDMVRISGGWWERSLGGKMQDCVCLDYENRVSAVWEEGYTIPEFKAARDPRQSSPERPWPP